MRGTTMGLLVLAATVAAGAPADAASFRCSEAKRPVEELICSMPELSRADELMGEAYAALLKAAGERNLDPALLERLRKGQRDWLALRNRTCTVPAGTATPGELTGAGDCLFALTSERTEDLRSLLEGLPISAMIDPQPVQESNDAKRYELDVTYPALASEVAGADGFNALVEKRVQARVEAFRAEAEKAEPVEDFRSTLTIGYDIVYASPQLISVSFAIAEFPAGAAHGLTVQTSLHYDLAGQRALAADDVFRPDSGWQAAVAGHALAELRRQGREDDFELFDGAADAVAGTVADLSHWRLGEDMATVVFDPYAVAAYAVGPREVSIGYSLLAPFLRPDGPLPPKP
ncbi:DUF3298 domain-containing protein [Azospirillum sp. ST 5-10]|uniref:DUF3298 domain-containing protein n=1 Tax=unclassified Azospirillum TaxID=2630922 RepID=UPI003F49C758